MSINSTKLSLLSRRQSKMLRCDRTGDHVADAIDRFWHDQRFDCGAVALHHLGKTSNQKNETLKAERKDLQAKVEILRQKNKELADFLRNNPPKVDSGFDPRDPDDN
jgi:uncharacterized protein YPO0396